MRWRRREDMSEDSSERENKREPRSHQHLAQVYETKQWVSITFPLIRGCTKLICLFLFLFLSAAHPVNKLYPQVWRGIVKAELDSHLILVRQSRKNTWLTFFIWRLAYSLRRVIHGVRIFYLLTDQICSLTNPLFFSPLAPKSSINDVLPTVLRTFNREVGIINYV